jgi:putative transposase
VRPGPKHWHISQKLPDSERRLADAKRKQAADRKTLHGQLANTLLRLANDFGIEKNSYRSFQRSFGKAVGSAAPATFVERIIQRFLSKTHIQNEELLQYAKEAYRGYVL